MIKSSEDTFPLRSDAVSDVSAQTELFYKYKLYIQTLADLWGGVMRATPPVLTL